VEILDEHRGRSTDEDVLAWRTLRFLELCGDDVDLADALARSKVDLHEYGELRARGCGPELAARILAPI
jgi:hypothetical protein